MSGRAGALSREEGSMVVQLRSRDTGLRPLPVADPATVSVIYKYLEWATLWLLVGTLRTSFRRSSSIGILSLGITYYALPRLLGRPIYFYALGVLGFWTNMVLYTVSGAHHFIFSPVPRSLQTTVILFSVGMMVPVWAGTGNFLLTLRGGWAAVRHSYAVPPNRCGPRRRLRFPHG